MIWKNNKFYKNFIYCLFLRSEKEAWKRKVVVDNTELKFHKLSALTEYKFSGPNSSNQIDRLKSMLKDEPKKKSYLVGGNLVLTQQFTYK